MRSFYKKKICRLCKSADLEFILSLGKTPPGNSLTSKKTSHKLKKFPLDLYFCNNCSHSQLGHVVDKSYLFQDNYTYLSSVSKDFVNHFRDYASNVVKRFGFNNSSLIVDIGSNDGTCLSFFKKKRCKVVGVDPAKNIAKIANSNGIYTYPNFFDKNIVNKILTQFGKASLITSHNCFAHIDNLRDIFIQSKKLLLNNGIIIFEVGYFSEVIKNYWFDTIYHEHLDYHMFSPLEKFLKGIDLIVFDVEIVKPQGGSLRIYCKKKDNYNLNISNRINNLIKKENSENINKRKYYLNFKSNLQNIRSLLKKQLIEITDKGKTIYAYGAPTKATTLMNYFNLDDKIIKFIFEDNSLKVNKYMPNSNIKIISSKFINKHMPDYVLILAWNFTKSIVKNHGLYLKRGGKFIKPLPYPQIISK